MTVHSPWIVGRLCTLLREFSEFTSESVSAEIKAFRERFPLSQLERLSGPELLIEMHGREVRDSFTYWLEFKKDETFQSRQYGSISGGSALKFTVYQAAEDHQWYGRSPEAASSPLQISVAEAVRIAEQQRDELLRAAKVFEAISDDPEDPGYATLHADVRAAAPEFHHLAFFHKALFLYFPERLDDFHSIRFHHHLLTSLGVVSSSDGIYANAQHFVRLLHQVRERLGARVPLSMLSAVLNRSYGAPIRHWRVGTGSNGEHWDEMRARQVVAVGWERLGDLSEIVRGLRGAEAIETLKRVIKQHWPETDNRVVGREARQLWKFHHGMQEGDRVYAAWGQTIRGVGVIEGPCEYVEDDFDFRIRRKVRWLSTESFKSVSPAGLRTTVCSLDKALDLRAQASRHVQGEEALARSRSGANGSLVSSRRGGGALDQLRAQLERKGQVVLYGPPGTGKTYHALLAAEAVVAEASYDLTRAELSPAQRDAIKGKADPTQQRIWVCTFHPAYGYEDFVEGLRPKPTAGGLSFDPTPGLFLRICELAKEHRSERFVLIIDEFNRGDAPRIFGELLTLLELDKRATTQAQLPLSGQNFSVPANVHILATMNTADRSISLLDAALRRRFGFVEYMPDATVLSDCPVEGIDLAALLMVINERLLQTLGDAARNLQVGHAYFMHNTQPILTLKLLREAVRYDIFPLLQEYCAEDPGALLELLGESFYDGVTRRFRPELFAPGKEQAFVEAVLDWDRDRLATELVDSEDGDEGDDDEPV